MAGNPSIDGAAAAHFDIGLQNLINAIFQKFSAEAKLRINLFNDPNIIIKLTKLCR